MSEELIKPLVKRFEYAMRLAADVDQQLKAWVATQKPEFHVQFAPDRRSYEIKVTNLAYDELLYQGRNMSACIHDFRACLDNLAFALARLHKDPPDKPAKIYFPIFQDEQEYSDKTKPCLRQMPDKVKDALKNIQPFNRKGDVVGNVSDGLPADDPLVLLNELENSDKHRIPLAFSLLPEIIQFSKAVKFFTEESAAKAGPPQVNINLPLHEEVPFVTIAFNEPIEEAAGEFDVKTILVLQTDTRVIPYQDQLLALGKYVQLVLSYFAGNFGVQP